MAALGALLGQVVLAHVPSLPAGAGAEAAGLARWLADRAAGLELRASDAAG